MLTGTADVDALLAGAATIAEFSPEALALEDVTCFQVTAEMRNRAREAVLPPSLHPTVPPALSLQVWDVGTSVWGPFTLALARVSCRSGVRARGFCTAALVSSERACAGLRATFGFPARVAEPRLKVTYLGVDVSVKERGRDVLGVRALDPEPMGNDDVQYTGTLTLCHTPLGARLVQVEAHHEATRVERLTAELTAFDAAAWGNRLFDPYLVVSASVATEAVTFPPVRFVCKADELAFTGTEAVA